MASPREDLVKLAERYNAIVDWMEKFATAADSGQLTREESEQLSSAYKDAMTARIAYQGIVSSIIKENDDHVSIIRDLPTEIDPGLSNIVTPLMKIVLKRKVPSDPSTCEMITPLKGPEREQSVENALSIFKAAEAKVNWGEPPSDNRRLELALKFSVFFSNVLKSPDAMRSIAMQAVDKAWLVWKAMIKERREMGVALDKADGELGMPDKDKRFHMYVHVLSRIVTFTTSMMQEEDDDGVTSSDEGQKKRKRMSNQETKTNDDGGDVQTASSGFQNQSMTTLQLVKHAECYKKMVTMVEKIADSGAGSLTFEERCVMKCAYLIAVQSRNLYEDIIKDEQKKKKKEKENDNDNDDCPTKMYPPLAKCDIWKVTLKFVDSREIPYAVSALHKLDALCSKAQYYANMLDEDMSEEDRNQAVNNMLSTFKDAQGIAHEWLPPSHPRRLELAIQYSKVYYKIIKSADDACKIAKKAVDEARAENPALNGVAMEVLGRNITHWTSMMQKPQGDDEGSSSTRKKLEQDAMIIGRRVAAA